MALLIVGLMLFLGAHSLRIVAEPWRQQQVARLGPWGWKAIIGLISLVGFVLLVMGYGEARMQVQPVLWWATPPTGMRHLASLLTLIAFVFLIAAYIPRNAIKARLGHPMILSVKVWALAHLLANGMLADIVLFGSFLVWAIFDFRSARRREPAGSVAVATSAAMTALTVVVGIVVWAAFAFWLHEWLIGVRPMG